MGDGCLVAERVYDCCSFMRGAASPTPSTSPLNHTSPLTEPLTSKEGPHLLSLTLSPSRPPFLFLHLSLSVSLSHALYPIGSVTLATLSKKPACGKTEVGVLIVCLWEREMGSPSLLCLEQHEAVFFLV